MDDSFQQCYLGLPIQKNKKDECSVTHFYWCFEHGNINHKITKPKNFIKNAALN